MSDNYSDIIEMPHHVSSNRQPMSMHARAAQFAPFAALTGHDDAIEKTEADNTSLYDTRTEQPDTEW